MLIFTDLVEAYFICTGSLDFKIERLGHQVIGRLHTDLVTVHNLGSGYLNSSNCPLREALERQGYRQNHDEFGLKLFTWSCPHSGPALYPLVLGLGLGYEFGEVEVDVGWRSASFVCDKAYAVRSASRAGSDGDGDWTCDAGGVGAVEAGPPLACVADVRGLGAVRARRVGTTWMEGEEGARAGTRCGVGCEMRRLLLRVLGADVILQTMLTVDGLRVHTCTAARIRASPRIMETIKANAMNWDPVKHKEEVGGYGVTCTTAWTRGNCSGARSGNEPKYSFRIRPPYSVQIVTASAQGDAEAQGIAVARELECDVLKKGGTRRGREGYTPEGEEE
ncbi:hypothetical protein B0H14DRAFT_3553282 [Mycena olivaceomarginata]|nr:hypothetical protein B0H14DRAFT_3553282 [Mycena olivaceomarginata]